MEHWQLLQKNNQLHSDIKKLEHESPDEVKKLGIKQCNKCKGSGLASYMDYQADPHKACKECIGIGYVGFKEFKDETVCPDCNASGFELRYENHVVACETCDGSGKLDWVDAIRKGVKLDKIW